MRLIVTEKNNSAKKIADILSNGTAKEDASFRTPFYTWGEGDDAQMTIGLKGHVLNPAFPEDYKSWQKIDPRDLIDPPACEGMDQGVHGPPERARIAQQRGDVAEDDSRLRVVGYRADRVLQRDVAAGFHAGAFVGLWRRDARG